MNEVKVAKFDPLQNQTAEDTVISIAEDYPISLNNDRTTEELVAYYENQAELIADALFNSLPQGTCDRLLIKLMQHKTSLYRGKTES